MALSPPEKAAAPHAAPPSTQEPLPLPQGVRKLRALLGAVLLFGLVGIVVATYYRIEQELQATLRTQLSAALEANVRSAFPGSTRTRSQLRRRRSRAWTRSDRAA